MSVPDLSAVLKAKPFKGTLFPQQASQAIDAARRTANEHLQTARLLFEHERFAHCISSSILAMEEAGKVPIIIRILLRATEQGAGWKEYVSHPAKTQSVNYAISLRIKDTFPGMPWQIADALGRAGPTPEILEKTKQRANYSDCLDKGDRCNVHDPSTVDWKDVANYVLADAEVFVKALRHYSAPELAIWFKHAKMCQQQGRDFETELPALERALREAGFIQPGSWKNVLKPDT